MDLQDIIRSLSQQAGPRGSTFAGRVVPQGEQPSLRDLMTRLPTESPDAEGMGAMAAAAGGAGGAAITKAQLKAGMRPTTQQFAELAREGVKPLTEPHKLLPAIINERTGEVINAMRPGPFQHKGLFDAVAGQPGYVSGAVDPLTFKAFTDKMLAALGQ